MFPSTVSIQLSTIGCEKSEQGRDLEQILSGADTMGKLQTGWITYGLRICLAKRVDIMEMMWDHLS